MIGPSGFFVDMKDSQCPIMPDELEMLHESGYGICLLYKARKEGRIFICKALRPEYRGLPVYEEMMKKDFAIGSSLHHPNICRYYAYATTPDFGNCILMEWVDGINLQQYIETNRCSVGKTKEKDRIVCEICAALEHMHRRQVVHRDLKPSNIMLTTNGMHAKIVDFGLSDSDSFAFMKIPAGTRLYASPELMAGERVDGRSDLWSLGVILREFGSSYFRISAKCMRRNPSERYDSAWEVMQDVLSPSRSIRKKIMVAAAMVCSTFIGVYAGAVLKDIIFESDESDSPAYDMRGLARPELLSGATLKVEEPLPEPFPVMMLPATQPCADPPHEVPQEPSRPATATDDTPAAAAGEENVMDSSDLEDLFRIAVEAIRK